jgi:DNA polymerase
VKPLTLVILGEAPGADEEASGQPFVGASGRLLRETMLPAVGLDARQFHILNTFVKRPPGNDLKLWTANKTELKKLGLTPQGDPLNKRYLLPEHHWQLAELDTRLRELQPNLIVCLGGTALWAVSGDGAIGTHRGTFFQSRYGLAIATYHPAALLRQWSNLPLAWSDLRKVAGHIAGTLPAPLRRRLYINPTWQEMGYVYAAFLRHPTTPLGVDIETCPSIDQITTISYATETLGICIPIWDKAAAPGKENVYASIADERRAWRWIDRFAKLPNPKVMQNGLYDSQYLMDAAPIDIRLRNWHDDTAILHHALQPELPKALGTLASIYLNEPSWKQMRTASKDEVKADE